MSWWWWHLARSFPREILELKKYGCINVHASLLPKYRGAAPIQWAVIDGEDRIRRYHHADGCRTGYRGYAAKDRGSPRRRGNRRQAYLINWLRQAPHLLLADTGGTGEEERLFHRNRRETTTAYATMLTKDTAEKSGGKKMPRFIERLVRGLTPWPSAYTHVHGKTLKVWRAEVCKGEDKKPGTVLKTSDGQLIIQTGNGRPENYRAPAGRQKAYGYSSISSRIFH